MKKKTLYIVLSATALLLLLALLIGASNGFNGFFKSIGRDIVTDSDSPIITVDPDGSASDAESESDIVIEPHVVELGIEDFFVHYDYTDGSDLHYVDCYVGTSELKPSTKYRVDIMISQGIIDKESFSVNYNKGTYYIEYCPHFSIEEEPELMEKFCMESDYDLLDVSFIVETSSEELNDDYGFVICLGNAYTEGEWAINAGTDGFIGYDEGYNIFDYFVSRGFSVTFTEVIE